MKKALASIVIPLATLLFPPPLLAARDPLATIAVLSGECRKLVVADVDHSVICAGNTANFAYRSNHSSFQFAAGHVVTLGFYGTDHVAVGDESFITVEKISMNRMDGKPSTLDPATGKCTYTNPYAGPSRIECAAISAGKTYSASFVSDGEEPAVRKF